METSYKHLNQRDRVVIVLMRKNGESCRAIARQLSRAPSTISREIRFHAASPGVAAAELPYESANNKAGTLFNGNGRWRG